MRRDPARPAWACDRIEARHEFPPALSLLVGLSALDARRLRDAPPERPSTHHRPPRIAHRIEVTPKLASAWILPVRRAATLRLTREARISRDFAGGYLRYGHGALVLSTPSSSDNADAAVDAGATKRA